MSINQLKALTWAASLGVAGFLGWYVYDFFTHKAEIAQAVSDEEQLAVLTSVPTPEPPKDDVVDYAIVLKTWHNMNWQPPEPPPPGETEETPVDVKPKHKPIAELLSVLYIQVDGGDPKRSMAQVSYLDQALISANTTTDSTVLMQDEFLTPPYDNVQVAKITRDGVYFRFLKMEGDGMVPDEEREDELVETTRLDTGPRIVRTDGEILRPKPREIQKVEQERPRVVPAETILLGDDHWFVGRSDREEIAQDYTRILAELDFKQHRDSSGKIDGVEIKNVPEGAFASKYGIKEGQIVKSINGHPISSVNEGIKFAKDNQDKYDVWTIVYEEQGKEKTKVIDTSE